jgi:hypothetical protein
VHHYALVVVPREGDVDRLVAEALAPYDTRREVELASDPEVDDGPEWHDPDALWDWYQVGGRWTGVLSGYRPADDPALRRACRWCAGTGWRDDEVGRARRAADAAFTCNGCGGRGEVTDWPTDWPRHEGDVVDALDLLVRVDELPDAAVPFAVLVHSGPALLMERWTGREWRTEHDLPGMRRALADLLSERMGAGHADRVVVVDYHS